MTPQEKAVWALVTPKTALKTDQQHILDSHPWTRKDFDTLRARFARKGYVLERVFRAGDGRATYHARRSGQARIFSHPHDVIAFMAQIGG